MKRKISALLVFLFCSYSAYPGIVNIDIKPISYYFHGYKEFEIGIEYKEITNRKNFSLNYSASAELFFELFSDIGIGFGGRYIYDPIFVDVTKELIQNTEKTADNKPIDKGFAESYKFDHFPIYLLTRYDISLEPYSIYFLGRLGAEVTTLSKDSANEPLNSIYWSLGMGVSFAGFELEGNYFTLNTKEAMHYKLNAFNLALGYRLSFF